MKNLLKPIAGVLLGILIYAAINAALQYNKMDKLDADAALKDLPWAGFMIVLIAFLIYEYGFKTRQKEGEEDK